MEWDIVLPTSHGVLPACLRQLPVCVPLPPRPAVTPGVRVSFQEPKFSQQLIQGTVTLKVEGVLEEVGGTRTRGTYCSERDPMPMLSHIQGSKEAGDSSRLWTKMAGSDVPGCRG